MNIKNIIFSIINMIISVILILTMHDILYKVEEVKIINDRLNDMVILDLYLTNFILYNYNNAIEEFNINLGNKSLEIEKIENSLNILINVLNNNYEAGEEIQNTNYQYNNILENNMLLE